MHVKRVSNVTFCHLSNRCLPNVLKINIKINTKQNTNILLFRSFSVFNELKECLIAVWPDFRGGLLTLQLTSEESVSRHVSVQMVDFLNVFVNKLLQTICIFMRFWFKWLLSIVSSFYCVDA